MGALPSAFGGFIGCAGFAGGEFGGDPAQPVAAHLEEALAVLQDEAAVVRHAALLVPFDGLLDLREPGHRQPRADRRKLLISLGTVSRDRDTRFFEVMMAALSEMPEIQAVMVAPESLASSAPANVLVRAYVPQLELLDRVDAVICHAGHNTVCESLSRGLPLIVAPIRDDQPVIARQVIDAGAGLPMRHGKVSPAMARSTIANLFNTPSLRHNAQRLAQSLLAGPGAAGAARLIESLLMPSPVKKVA